MTPGARLAAAMEILDGLEISDIPADSFIRSFFRSRRYAGSKDRRAVGERVYTVIRNRSRLDWWIAGAAGNLEPTARLRVLASLLLLDQDSQENIFALFSGEGHAPVTLDDKEQELVDNIAGKPLHHAAMPEGVVHEVPAWLSPLLEQQWGEEFAVEMAALNTTATVDVRVNASRVSRQQARKSLLRDNVNSEHTPLSPLGLRLMEHTGLSNTRAFKKGLIEIQDEGSQLIGLLCQARPGMTVIDYCAGAGGKTLALADIMGIQGDAQAAGRLIACDVSANRLARMDDRLSRAGTAAVERIALPESGFPEGLQNSADRVLVDAPCSGSGSWRRHPEARWRLSPERLKKHEAEQRTVLENAAGLVKAGGRLIYATCSLLRQENEDQIAWLLEKRPDFKCLSMGKIWIEALGMASPPGVAGPQYLNLSPARTGTDGFYCAVLEKQVENA